MLTYSQRGPLTAGVAVIYTCKPGYRYEDGGHTRSFVCTKRGEERMWHLDIVDCISELQHLSWASYQICKIAGCMFRKCRGRFPHHRLQRKPLVNDPDMMHVPWCMPWWLSRGGGENVPGIPGACTTRAFTYLARDPLMGTSVGRVFFFFVTYTKELVCYKLSFIRRDLCGRNNSFSNEMV